MGTIFKSIGKGILYILIAPFYVLGLLLIAIAGLFGLLYLFIKSIVLFFTGRSLRDDLPEDRKAKAIKNGEPLEEEEEENEEESEEEQPEEQPQEEPKEEEKKEETPVVAPVVTPVTNPVPEEKKEEPVVPAPAPAPNPAPTEEKKQDDVLSLFLDTSKKENQPKQEEKTPVKPIGVYKTNNPILIEDKEKEEKEETGGGVTISYGGKKDEK